MFLSPLSIIPIKLGDISRISAILYQALEILISYQTFVNLFYSYCNFRGNIKSMEQTDRAFICVNFLPIKFLKTNTMRG